MLLQAVDRERHQLHVTLAELRTELSRPAEFSGADGSEVSRMREQDAPADGGNMLHSWSNNLRHISALDVSESNI